MSSISRSWKQAWRGALTVLLLAAWSTGSVAADRVIYYHNDLQGSPVAATDASGEKLWEERYDPYGSRRLNAEGGGNRQWYTGKEEDATVGLQYFGARWYDPALGRFTGMDPVGFKPRLIQTFNKFAYAVNNPYKYIDPDGREVKLQSHEVAFGDHHTLLRITPENQKRYSNDPRFSNTDSDGRIFATMGAGPEGGKLVSRYNRSSDAEPHEGGVEIQPPGNTNEDDFIDRLHNLDSRYSDNLDYDLFPSSEEEQVWWRADDGYNSNSYTSGLLKASGVNAPKPNVSAPGWDKPIPRQNFE